MIVIQLKEGQPLGKLSNEKYVNATRNYDNQIEGEPYITAELANDTSQTTFPVGDGKYYSRDGVTDAKRKRRDSSSFIAYLNGKLDENTKYAVLQRSFDQDGNYENEGFIKFTTKKVIKEQFPTALMALSIVVGLLAALILVGGIKMWRRHHNENKISPRNAEYASRQESYEMFG